MRKFLLILTISFRMANVIAYDRDDCFCGVVNENVRRITNGKIVQKIEYPWMVALFDGNRKPFCGGSLISDRHVLTASHCISFDPSQPSHWLKLYGKVGTFRTDQGEAMNFDRVNIHPNFKDHGTFDDYDLGVLRFRKKIGEFSENILPICLPEKAQNYGGKSATIAGWGTTDPDMLKMTLFLREGEITILPLRSCPSATNLRRRFNLESMICGYSVEHIDTCPGDSGGPIIVSSNKGTYEIVGVSSFGERCGGMYAGVYAEVSNSLKWIKQIISEGGVCPRERGFPFLSNISNLSLKKGYRGYLMK